MRGSSGLTLKVTTAHSGRYGGLVLNALHVLARIVASLHDDAGRIAVPGFLDGAVPAGEAAIAALERLWLRPTIEVNGMWGGNAGPGRKTVIPAEAHAKLTARLAPGQDPDRAYAALEAHLTASCPPEARLEILDTGRWTGAYTVRSLGIETASQTVQFSVHVSESGMDRLLTRRTASMVEMREPGKVLKDAGGEPVAILKNNRCVAHLVTIEAVAAVEPRHASMDEIMAAFEAERARLQVALDCLKDR